MPHSLARLSIFKSHQFLNDPAHDFDADLRNILVSATALARRYCARRFFHKEYIDYYTGDDTTQLFIDHEPLITVSEVALWNQNDYQLEDPDNYRVDEGWIRYPILGRESQSLWEAWRSDDEDGIRVTYEAGYYDTHWYDVPLDGDYNIIAADPDTKTFTIAENAPDAFPTGSTIRIAGSFENDGEYTVVSASWTGTATEIIVSEALVDDTADGTIVWIKIPDNPDPTYHAFNVPADLEMAICLIGMKLAKDAGWGSRFGLRSMSRGGESIAPDSFVLGIPEEAKLILNTYKKASII